MIDLKGYKYKKDPHRWGRWFYEHNKIVDNFINLWYEVEKKEEIMKELLFSITKKDLDIQYYKASGKGGQNRNKRETAVRIVHKDSGVTVIACDERTQGQNLKIAFNRLVKNDKFQKWLHVEAARKMQDKKEIEKKLNEEVDDWVQDKYLKIETFTPEE